MSLVFSLSVAAFIVSYSSEDGVWPAPRIGSANPEGGITTESSGALWLL